MYLYILFFVIALCAFFDVLYPIERRGWKYIGVYTLIITILFILSAFRVERGSDWNSYKWYYEAAQWDYPQGMEWGYDLLNRVLHLISDNYSLLIFAIAFIIFVLKAPLNYKLSKFPFVTLLVWFAIYFCDIFPNRQFIATAILLMAMVFVQRRKPLYFISFVILASMFHISALVFLIAYKLYYWRFSKWTLLTLFAGIYGLSILAVNSIQGLLGAISSPIIQARLEDYLEAGQDMTFGEFSARQTLIRGFVNRMMVMAVIFFTLDKLRKKDIALNGWINIYTMGAVIFPVFASINMALSRISWYFDFALMFVIPYFFLVPMTRASKMIVWCAVSLYLLYRFIMIVNNYYDLYIPYKGLFWNTDIEISIF